MPFSSLSSRLTFAYKLLIPVATLAALGIYVFLMLTRRWPMELHGVVAACFLGMWLLFVLLISLRIRHVAYNKTFIRVKNYRTFIQFSAKEYVFIVPCFMPEFYRLRTSTHEYLFLANYVDTMISLLTHNPNGPESIRTARSVLSRHGVA